MTSENLEKRANDVRQGLLRRMESGTSLAIVKAPPGSGKTHLLVEALARAAERGQRVTVATPTRPQSHEICLRLRAQYPHVNVLRFLSSSDSPDPSWAYDATSDKSDLRSLTQGVVVATAAKWSYVDLSGERPYEYLVVEEAWQLKLGSLIPLCQVAKRFVLVGDPGQIDPVVGIDSSRWVTAPMAPHRPAPAALMDRGLVPEEDQLKLPATRRLPRDSASLLQRFYDFPFDAHAAEGERRLEFRGRTPSHMRRLCEALDGASVVGLALDRSAGGGPSFDGDRPLAELAARTIEGLLSMRPVCQLGPDKKDRIELKPEHIGLAATHRTMVQELSLCLPGSVRNGIHVDTPERWQGLECPVMLVVHPLSSVTRPSEFDLETGRLCVMASRHKAKLIVLTRDHVPETLEEYHSPGDQPLGWEDEAGKGHAAHLGFVGELRRRGMWVAET